MSKYLISEAIVFITDNNYNIIWNTTEKGLAWVEIGNEKFYDEDNGNIKSEEKVHKVIIKKNILDESKKYTICFKKVIERSAYYPKSEDYIDKKEYVFKPVAKKESYKTYMIADTHSVFYYAAKAGNYFGEDLDFLILNGDIADKSKDVESILTTYKLAELITKGEIPVVFARGNHDTRGNMAPDLYKYVGTDNGNMYFKFVIGDIFGIVLDAGEDKTDDHCEYGGMANFQPYREKQVKFLEEIVSKKEYNNYNHKIVICHIPVNEKGNLAFSENYNKWIELLNTISPDMMLSGHMHEYYVTKKGETFDCSRMMFPIVVGSMCTGNSNTNNAELPPDFIGTAIEIKKDCINLKFTNSKQEILEEFTLEK